MEFMEFKGVHLIIVDHWKWEGKFEFLNRAESERRIDFM